MDYIVKVFLFSLWSAILYFFVNAVTNFVLSYVSSISFLPWLQVLGVIKALNLLLSILISCFISKKLITFWQSA